MTRNNRQSMISLCLLALCFSLLQVEGQQIQHLGDKNWQIKDILYKFSSYVHQDPAAPYTIKIGDLKVLGVGNSLEGQNVVLPECLFFHLNYSATFIKSCNFLNPDFFLNSTTLFNINKDLVQGLFQGGQQSGAASNESGGGVQSTGAPIANESQSGSEVASGQNASMGGEASGVQGSQMLDDNFVNYLAFRLNNSHQQLFKISDVYEFMPEEIASFLVGQMQPNISGGAAGQNVSGAEGANQTANQTSNASQNQSRGRRLDHVESNAFQGMQFIDLIRQRAQNSNDDIGALQQIIDGLNINRRLDQVIKNAIDQLRNNFNASYDQAQTAFLGQVGQPMVTAIVDYIADGINRIQALENDLVSSLQLQSADIFKILYDASVQHGDLTQFFQQINMPLEQGGWVILSNLQDCVQMQDDQLSLDQSMISSGAGAMQNQTQNQTSNVSSGEGGANQTQNVSGGAAGAGSQDLKTFVICKERGLRRAWRYFQKNDSSDMMDDQEFNQALQGLNKKPWIYLFDNIYGVDDRFQQWVSGQMIGGQNVSQPVGAAANATNASAEAAGGASAASSSSVRR